MITLDLLKSCLDALPGQVSIQDLQGVTIYQNKAALHADFTNIEDVQRFPLLDPKDGTTVIARGKFCPHHPEGEASSSSMMGDFSSSSQQPGTAPSTSSIGPLPASMRNIRNSTIATAAAATTATATTAGADSAKRGRHRRSPSFSTLEGEEPPPKLLKAPSTPAEEERWEQLLRPVQGSGGGNNYQRLFANMPMGATLNEVVTDADGKPTDWIFREVNPAFGDLCGLQTHNIIGNLASECLPLLSQDPSNWIQKFGKVALEGNTLHFDQQYDISMKKWLRGMAYQPDGQDRFFVTLYLDVSDNIQAQEDLRDSEERHRSLFESMTQGVIYQDSSARIISANPSACRMFGLALEQMLDPSAHDGNWKTVHPDGSVFLPEDYPVTRTLKTGKPITGVLMGFKHEQKEVHRWVEIDTMPRFRLGETQPYQACSTLSDMTQAKDFEAQLLQEKNRAQMADRLKSAFLANMSHEIRTPLNGIIGHIDLALASGLSDEQRLDNLEGLNVARQSGDLLISIIQDILDLSKIEAGQLDIDHDGDFSLRKLIEQVQCLGESMILQRKKTISLKVTVDDTIHDQIYGDVFRLQQILNNLMSNAIKFTDQGRVTVSIQPTPDKKMLKFIVCDTGKGIPEEHRQTIFEPFTQVEFGDTRKHGGTGLGLTISKKLVEMMGGAGIELESSVEPHNHGTCFSFTFPYKAMTVASDGEQTVMISGEGSSSQCARSRKMNIIPANNKGKILVAEDDRVSRRLVNRMLTIAGYDVILAENGAIALEKFQSNEDISLILMDVQMPKMDGLTATRKIRELEKEAGYSGGRVPIIALSANAMKGDDEIGLGVGMNDYLTKPVDFKVLKTKLVSHLGAGRTKTSSSTTTAR